MGAWPQPSNPFLQGMMDSAHLALAIKQSHMEQQALAMRQQEMQRRNQVDDLNTRMGLLQSGASPTQASGAGPEIPGGASVHTPGATIDGIEVGGSDQAAPRPVDPGRTVNYGGQQYYVPTPAEQFQSQLPIMQAQNLLKAQGMGQVAGAEAAAKQPYDQVELPGVGKVSSKAVPYYTSQNTQNNENARQDKTIRANADLEASREKGQDSRSAANNATSRRNTDVREAGEDRRESLRDGGDGTPGQKGVAARFRQRLMSEREAVQTKASSAQESMSALDAALGAQDGDTVKDDKNRDVELNANTRQALQSRRDFFSDVLAAHKKRLGEISKEVDGAQPPVPGTQQPAPAGRVWVKNKAGQLGHIPKEQLDAALKSGYTKAE